MKVLLVHNKYSEYGGEDSIVEKQYQLYKKKGIDVELYTKSNNNIDSLSIINKIKMIKESYSSKKTESELIEITSNFNADIVHIHNVYPIISPGVYEFFYKRNIPIIQTLHNYRFICPNGLMFRNNSVCEKCLKNNNYYECFYNKCYHESYMQSLWYSNLISNSFNKGVFNKINKFIALNNFVKQKMIEKGYDGAKIEIIPNSTNEKPTLECYDKKDYYLYIGRISNEKGVNTIIKTFSMLNNINLKIVGTGPLENEIKNFIKEKGINNIEYIGFKNGIEKDNLIRFSKAIIVPSEWYENFPTVVLEAFSLGTMVIASDIGGLKYMIKNDYNGIKFKSGDVFDLKQKLLLIDRNKELIAELSKNAYNTYINYYTEDIYYNKHMNLYNNLIKR